MPQGYEYYEEELGLNSEDLKVEFNNLSESEKEKYTKFDKWYLKKLDILTKLIEKRTAIPIFITHIVYHLSTR